MAFLLEILLVNSSRHLNGRSMVIDEIYSRYPVRTRRTRKVAEEFLRIANILYHVRLRRQVFHVSAHTLNQTLANLTPPPSVFHLLATKSSWYPLFMLTRSSKPPLLPTHLPTPTVQNSVTNHSPRRHWFYGLLLLRNCFPVVR